MVPVLGGVIAVILGVIGLVQISRSNGARTGTGLAVAGLVLGLLTCAGYLTLFSSSSFQETLRQRLEDTRAALDGAARIEPGDCLDVEVAETTSFLLDDSDVVACDEPHGAEFAGRVTLPNPPSEEYPGDDEVFAAGLDLCLDTFVDHVGVDLAEQPELDLLVVFPQETVWQTGDRNVECLIIHADASPLDGPVG